MTQGKHFEHVYHLTGHRLQIHHFWSWRKRLWSGYSSGGRLPTVGSAVQFPALLVICQSVIGQDTQPQVASGVSGQLISSSAVCVNR